MGLLTDPGTPLSWEESKQFIDHIKKHGIVQFINAYHRLKDRKNDQLKWGDEIEYILVHFDDAKKRAQLALLAPKILPLLQAAEDEFLADPSSDKSKPPMTSLWRPEYAKFQVEGTPGAPYGSYLSCFNDVENNMRLRRAEVQKLLPDTDRVLSFTSFPSQAYNSKTDSRMGCPEFTCPPVAPTPGQGMTRSLMFADDCIFQDHPRFATITANCHARRGRIPDINLPLFIDKNTPRPFTEDFGGAGDAWRYAKADSIYIDAMGLGNGCCCLQVTFQACNMDEARQLYDQLATLAPLMLALTAGSPIYRGYLSDYDCRWKVLAEGSDDRTDEERGIQPLLHDKYVISKSRYDCIDCYLSPQGKQYSDVKLNYDPAQVQQMMDAGVDEQLAHHVAHLFVRDPLVIFSERIHQDDENETDHFENFNSTNWQTVRFKAPPPESEIGWRVEFRPMDLQMTDFENAACVTFIVLLTRVILSFKLNFLVPISKMEANMDEAIKRNAAREGLFYFRENILPVEEESTTPPSFFRRLWTKYVRQPSAEDCPKLTIDEIFNGKRDEFPGLIPLIEEYLNDVDLDVDTSATLQTYLAFIRKRASGNLLTTASWMRKFVHNHPAYKHDSVVSEEINYDLMKTADKIANGDIHDPELSIQHICIPGRHNRGNGDFESQATPGTPDTTNKPLPHE